MPKNQLYDDIEKILIIGEHKSGKSALLQRYIYATYDENYTPTLGVEFESRIIAIPIGGKEKKVKQQIWDTSGQSHFQSVTRSYYPNAQAFIICCDLSDENPIPKLKEYISSTGANPNATIILVGTKVDKIDDPELKERIKSNMTQLVEVAGSKFSYFITSAKDENNPTITNLFSYIGEQHLKNMSAEEQSLDSDPDQESFATIPIAVPPALGRDSYRALWNASNKSENELDKVLRIFSDYEVKGTGWRSLLYFHPNRHHVATVHNILNQPHANVETFLATLKNELESRNEVINPTGSLASRIKFVQYMTQVKVFDFDVHSNSPRPGFK